MLQKCPTCWENELRCCKNSLSILRECPNFTMHIIIVIIIRNPWFPSAGRQPLTVTNRVIELSVVSTLMLFQCQILPILPKFLRFSIVWLLEKHVVHKSSIIEINFHFTCGWWEVQKQTTLLKVPSQYKIKETTS